MMNVIIPIIFCEVRTFFVEQRNESLVVIVESSDFDDTIEYEGDQKYWFN